VPKAMETYGKYGSKKQFLNLAIYEKAFFVSYAPTWNERNNSSCAYPTTEG